jgi:hypothetical protein
VHAAVRARAQLPQQRVRVDRLLALLVDAAPRGLGDLGHGRVGAHELHLGRLARGAGALRRLALLARGVRLGDELADDDAVRRLRLHERLEGRLGEEAAHGAARPARDDRRHARLLAHERELAKVRARVQARQHARLVVGAARGDPLGQQRRDERRANALGHRRERETHPRIDTTVRPPRDGVTREALP